MKLRTISAHVSRDVTATRTITRATDGNSTQAGSPHLEDQLPLMVQKTLHPVWREKNDIEANLEKRESF
jgi:acyl-homoserine lactone acylase PvdQ